jgi:7-carboxy-7-deazaguanine synthase
VQTNLRITEIFYSLQGETRTTGLPTVFIRLTGCPLRCHYCDTAYAFTGGEELTQAEVLAQVAEYQPHYVTVTGGEPLAQKACLPLLSALCDQGYDVSLETSGALTISDVDSRVSRVIDLKTPDSGEADKNYWDNLDSLNANDQLKFVICSREDYEWSKMMLDMHDLATQCEVLFSPVHGDIEPRQLASWILEDRLPVRFQLQLHKYLWNDEPGR